jgi:ketosteroid isomerase-like protein
MSPNHPHPNEVTLQLIYSDLLRISEFVDEDVVLHAATRDIESMPAKVIGKAAVLAHEEALVRMTENTLVMSVRSISANDHFGAVLGELRARRSGAVISMPFCGLWRCREGRILEHWENAYDARALIHFLTA